MNRILSALFCLYKLLFSCFHMENKFQKILYSLIETYFLTNDNPYGRSFSLRRVSIM